MLPDANFNDFVQWVFYGAISFGVHHIVRSLGALEKSVAALNINVARVIEKTTHHENRLDKHEERLIRVEENR